MQDPAVSIVISTFNRAEKLKRAVSSALSQTHRRVEILVVDDGSTDNTRDVLSQFHDSRLLVEYLSENSGGPSTPRNIGVRMSRGKWIAFLDSDDWWEPNHLKNQLSALERSGLRAACGNAFNYPALRPKPEVLPNELSLMEVHHEVLPVQIDLSLLIQANLIITSSVVMLREDVLRAEGFPLPINGQVFEDYALWLRAATFGNFVVCDEICVHYQTDSPDSYGAHHGHEDAQRNTFLELQNWLRRVTPDTSLGVLSDLGDDEADF